MDKGQMTALLQKDSMKQIIFLSDPNASQQQRSHEAMTDWETSFAPGNRRSSWLVQMIYFIKS